MLFIKSIFGHHANYQINTYASRKWNNPATGLFFFFTIYSNYYKNNIYLKQPFKPGSSSFDLIFLILTVFPLKVDNINLCLK